MKRNPMLWSTLRQPVRSLLFLLVIAVASFAFVARATEYLVVSQETERLKDYYRPVGYLEPENVDFSPNNDLEGMERWHLKDVTLGIPIIEDRPDVNWVDQRRYCSGVLQGMQNADIDAPASDSPVTFYYNEQYGIGPIGLYVDDAVLCGTLLSKGEDTQPELYRYPIPSDDEWYMHEFLFQVDTVEAGFRDVVQEGAKVPLLLIAQRPEEIEAAYAAVQQGQRYLIRTLAVYDAMWWGEDGQHAMNLRTLNEQGLYFYPLAPEGPVDWEDPALDGLWDAVEVIRENQSAMAVIGSKDMSALPRMQEVIQDYYLAKGRWLNQEADLLGRQVCVIHKNFAALRGLDVGDTLTLPLRDLQAPLHSSLSVAGYDGVDNYIDRILVQEAYILESTEDWEHWKDYPTETKTFEIVGLYGSKEDSTVVPNGTGALNLYIPDSCMPEGYGQEEQVHMDAYSFRLRSAEDAEAFLQAVEGPLADLGLRVQLVDKGWENFAASARPIQRSTTLNAVVFSLMLLLVLALFAFLHLRQKQNEFAIQRALGVPQHLALRHMLLPITLLGTLGIVAGGIPAWGYALGKARETLATLQNAEGVAVTTTLPAFWLAILCIAALLALLLLTLAGACAVARHPVLELLQGSMADRIQWVGHPGRQARPAAPSMGQAIDQTVQQGWLDGQAVGQASSQTSPAGGTGAPRGPGQDRSIRSSAPRRVPSMGKAVGLFLRYTLRHVRRAPLKSILTVTLALCFLLALGWMNWTMERNEMEVDRLYRTTKVTGEIIRGPGYDFREAKKTGGAYMLNSAVETVLKSGFVQHAYLEAGSVMSIAPLDEAGAADQERRIRNLWARSFDQPDVFFTTDTGKGAEVEYAPGWDETLFATHEKAVVLPEMLMTILDMELGQEVYLMDNDGRGRGNFVVAGQYTGGIRIEGAEDPIILLPLGTMQDMKGNNLFYAVAKFEFDPEKNREMADFRAVINRMNLGYQSVQCQIKDEVLREVVEPLEKNLSLMGVLYPVTMGVSALIALGLALLLVIQSAREAAILRVLGTPKGKTWVMLGGGQVLLCLLGLLLGLAALTLLRQDVAAVLGGPSLLCAGLYLAGSLCGTIAGAAYVTKDKALELLQVKE